MKTTAKKLLIIGGALFAFFLVWTALVLTVDVRPLEEAQNVGFSTVNEWFHNLTGVNMKVYDLTDILGSVPFFICLCFAFVGLVQWIQRKNMFLVDADILILGGYYILVILSFLFFEKVPVNYRPVLIEGKMESSFPSSTTLLCASVVPALIEQLLRRIKNATLKWTLIGVSSAFGVFMVVARLLCGVHWLTDIVGGLILSAALFIIYLGCVKLVEKK